MSYRARQGQLFVGRGGCRGQAGGAAHGDGCGVRINVGVGGVEKVDVGEEEEPVGLHEDGDLRAQRVVIADAQLLNVDRVLHTCMAAACQRICVATRGQNGHTRMDQRFGSGMARCCRCGLG